MFFLVYAVRIARYNHLALWVTKDQASSHQFSAFQLKNVC